VRTVRQLAEATYARDRAVRDQAQRFYDDLVRYLDVPEDVQAKRLIVGGDGSVAIMMRAFTDAGTNGVVVLGPGGTSRRGGVGRWRSMDALVLYVLKGPGDLTGLVSRVASAKNTIIHEVVHLLDPGRRAGVGGAHALDRGGEAAYYNEPSEWNAYWQEGAAALERMLHQATAPGLSPKAAAQMRDWFFGDGSLKALLARVERFWDVGFLDAMDAETRRRFDKRLAALWAELRGQGLLREGVRALLRRLEEGVRGASRQQTTGRYAHSNLYQLCKTCGHPLGCHSGESTADERYCMHNDLSRLDDTYCNCEKFVASRKYMDRDAYEREYG
jgi:hypothetical protein